MAHLGQGAEEGAFRIDADGVEPFEVGDVDDPFGLGDAAFCKVDQRGTASQQHGRRHGGRTQRLFDRACAKIGEISHDITFAASRTASTMCG